MVDKVLFESNEVDGILEKAKLDFPLNSKFKNVLTNEIITIYDVRDEIESRVKNGKEYIEGFKIVVRWGSRSTQQFQLVDAKLYLILHE